FYGDATRLDILRSAGADSARVLFIAIDSPATVNKLVATARKHFPHLKVMARAGTNLDAHELLDLGVRDIYRDFLDTSVRAGVDVLASLGY
ncbi:NAD-binding protein, partial [Klebsiella pneumoniae]|nr:NAD-binding protein [Klebsiella pneumoniae]